MFTFLCREQLGNITSTGWVRARHEGKSSPTEACFKALVGMSGVKLLAKAIALALNELSLLSTQIMYSVVQWHTLVSGEMNPQVLVLLAKCFTQVFPKYSWTTSMVCHVSAY